MPSPTTNRILYGGHKNYVLDKLGADAVNSLVLGMSYVRMTKKYKGACLRVTRASDFASIWVEFSDGYIAISQIAAFCAGTEGRCPEHCNQSLVAGANNAVQATWANMPIVYSGGVFNADGLNFVAASSNRMSIVDYAAVKIAGPKVSFYQNISVSGTMLLHEGFIWERRNKIGSLIYRTQYSAFINGSARLFINTNDTQSKAIFSWQGTGTNEGKSKVNNSTNAQTYNDSITTENVAFNIGYGFSSFYFNGYIKTIAIFNSDQYNNYSNFVNGGM